jgi:hypothetical protein
MRRRWVTSISWLAVLAAQLPNQFLTNPTHVDRDHIPRLAQVVHELILIERRGAITLEVVDDPVQHQLGKGEHPGEFEGTQRHPDNACMDKAMRGQDVQPHAARATSVSIFGHQAAILVSRHELTLPSEVSKGMPNRQGKEHDRSGLQRQGLDQQMSHAT